MRPVYDQGAAGLGLALRRLQTTASVLHVGAHPDDEDSALIARLARTDGARVAYLSLNRGEGGQNRIGAELSDALGVIRTEELLQARRLDGGQQFFARTFDFGFTKTLGEAQSRWDEREVLADMVRVIRTFRPLVVVSRWQGTTADGHGQHQFAGYLAPRAFRAAADPAQFPEQLAEGLRPWQAKKFYVSASQGAASAGGTAEGLAGVVRIETGDYDPLLGRTAYELAMEGRSQHKSQGETALELRGAQASGARLVERAPSPMQVSERERTLFDGLDTTIRGMSRLAGLPNDEFDQKLQSIQNVATTALDKFNALDPRSVIAALNAGLVYTRSLIVEVGGRVDNAHTRVLLGKEGERLPHNQPDYEPDRVRRELIFLLEQKQQEFSNALRLAVGARVDALADAETVARGDSFAVVVRAYAPEELKGRVTSVRLRAPEGWSVEELTAAPAASQFGRERATREAYYRVSVPETAEFTQPYWLKQERKGDMYEWGKDDPQTQPFAPAPLVAEVGIDAGETFTVEQPVEYRYLDGVRGEVRREVNVVPELDIQLTPNLVIVPRGRAARGVAAAEFAVQVTNNVRRTTEGEGNSVVTGATGLRAPKGWRAPAPAAFRFTERGERATFKFLLRVPASAKHGAYKLDATAAASFYAPPRAGPTRWFGNSQRTLSYAHVQTHRLFPWTGATVRVVDLKVAPVRVGYVMGSGDEVPAAIERMGLKVTMLGEDDLASGDLSRFDTIVVGVRASQSRPDFVANHKRLIEFVERGGGLIVQYQRPDYAAQKLPPLPATMEARDARGSQQIARVVDETAPVRVLQPAHPVFNFPNKITEDDWRGWVQERNLYNFVTQDARFVPLLESHDAGEPENSGGMVYARLGRGHYVYTSYAFFRQLPAGVPGAYRLFANLLSLPKASAASAPASRWRFRKLD
ncbi:MAG: PIG-L family deacetylase [Acidobacteria bacterium]|nr:PIG-L family deacetylase [Acidobacteriota bacterium]MCA1642686.1 PIG-L family deacetylase [Acidobacteriota bacterium]